MAPHLDLPCDGMRMVSGMLALSAARWHLEAPGRLMITHAQCSWVQPRKVPQRLTWRRALARAHLREYP